jgi:predicted HTH domain antitoxin
MSETTIQVRIPVPLLRFGFDVEEIECRIAEWLALSLFTEGKVSSGKAAKLLGISRVQFLALLRARGIAYINYTSDELAEEFEAVEKLKVKDSE